MHEISVRMIRFISLFRKLLPKCEICIHISKWIFYFFFFSVNCTQYKIWRQFFSSELLNGFLARSQNIF